MAKQEDFDAENSICFNGAKNALQPMGEKQMDKKKEKDRSLVIPGIYCVECGVSRWCMKFGGSLLTRDQAGRV